MKWIWLIFALVIFLGPLRRWIGRHWCLLVSLIGGWIFGFVLGAKANAMSGGMHPLLPVLWGLIGAIAAGRVGPALLRHIEKDGRDGHVSRRH